MDLKSWRNQYRKDQLAQLSLYKELSKLFPINKASPHAALAHEIIREQDRAQSQLKREEMEVIKPLRRLRTEVQQFAGLLKSCKKGPEHLLEVQQRGERLERELGEYKERMVHSWEANNIKKRELFDFVEDFAERVSRMERGGEECEMRREPRAVRQAPDMEEQEGEREEESVADVHLRSLDSKLRAIQRQSEEVEEILGSWGRNLGWSQDDHLAFIKLYKKHKGNSFTLADDCVSTIMGCSQQEANQHIDKYKRQQDLLERRKELIAQYKAAKEEKRAAERRRAEEEAAARESVQGRLEEQLRKENQERENRIRKEQLQLWKQKKQAEKQLQQLCRIQEEERRKERARQLKMQRERRKEAAARESEQREAEEERSAAERRPQTATSRVSVQTRTKIQERERAMLQRKLALAQERQEREELNQMREERLRQQKMIKWAYVPNKLAEQTKAAGGKKRQKFDGKERKEAETFGGQVLQQGGRAIPQWRQGI